MFAYRLVLSKSFVCSSPAVRCSRINNSVAVTFFSKSIAGFNDSATISEEKAVADMIIVAELKEIDKSVIYRGVDLPEPIQPENRFETGQRTTKLSVLPELLSAIIGSTGSTDSGSDCIATSTTTTVANTITTNDQLWLHFWQVVIDNGVPAVFTTGLIVLALGVYRIGRSTGRDENKSILQKFDFNNDDNNIGLISELYDDLYSNQNDQDPVRRRWNSYFPYRKKQQQQMLKNIGIPKQKYIKITCMNDKYDSFMYSVNAATTSKANAALQFRQSSLVRALRKVIGNTDSDTTTITTTVDISVWKQLQQLEQIYLVEISELYNQLHVCQNQLTVLSIEDELISHTKMDKKDVYNLLTQIDPKMPITAEIISVKNSTNSNSTAATPTATADTIATADTTATDTTAKAAKADTADTTDTTDTTAPTPNTPSTPITPASDTTTSLTSMTLKSTATGRWSSSSSSSRSELLSSIRRIQKDINELDMEFVKRIIRVAGPDKAAGINAALLGTPGGVTSTGFLSSTTMNGERPLTRIFGSNTGSTGNDQKKNIYVMNFPGDITASQVSDLRQVVTSIILAQNQKRKHSISTSSSTSTVQDEAIVVLKSGGGTVTGYGLAAAQLLRLKEQGKLKLTICVEQVAASGGYMMACCADTIIASPFAALGSIGVIREIPNVYDRLQREGIEFQTITAGKYKRTITPTKKVTQEDLEKSKKDIEEMYTLFRNFVKTNRPQLDIDSVATGEVWFGSDALDRKLCDEIKTVDDVLVDRVANGHNVYQIEYEAPMEDRSVLGRFLSPATDYVSISDNNNNNILQKPIRWLIRTISDAVKEEVYSTMSKGIETPIEKRYMMKDDTAKRIRFRS